MKAEELMIGDYFFVEKENLCIRKGTVVEIRGIDADDRLDAKNLIGNAHCHPLDPFQFDGGIWLDYLEPIPLTPEILEENGFKKSESDTLSQTWAWAEKSEKIYNRWVQITFYNEPINGVSYLTKIETCSSKGDGVNNLHSCDIESVHQLQHALRLCGINKEIVL